MQTKDVYVECTNDSDVDAALRRFGSMRTSVEKGTVRLQTGWEKDFIATLQYEKRDGTYYATTPNGLTWRFDGSPTATTDDAWNNEMNVTEYNAYSFTLSCPRAVMKFKRDADGTMARIGILTSSTTGVVVSLKTQFTLIPTLRRIAELI